MDNFADDKLLAVKSFVHTMIVVDDETASVVQDEAVTKIVRPARVSKLSDRGNDSNSSSDQSVRPISHPMNGKALVDAALSLGIVCAVVAPLKGEEKVPENVAQAALRADIVSLDWHMNGADDGALATAIISSILLADRGIGGRLRLIAIYTGEPRKELVFETICDAVNKEAPAHARLVEREGALVNEQGLRIVWCKKALNSKSEGVSEVELPNFLLKEFSLLTNGLLSNVALASISSMRDTTHHVLNKLRPELDGPYFHHRALLRSPSDAMDYGVSIVLSALKAEVDKAQIATKFGSEEAIRRRIASMVKDGNSFKLKYVAGKGDAKTNKCNELSLDEVVEIVTKGWSSLSDEKKQHAFNDGTAQRMAGLSKKIVSKYFSSIFFDTVEDTRRSLIDFSYTTNIRSSELSRIHRTVPPKLDLGSIVYSEESGYLFCLQASCDTGVDNNSFFFVPLIVDEDTPDHVVPHGMDGDVVKHVCLSMQDNSYTLARSICFPDGGSEFGFTTALFDPVRSGYFLKDIADQEYRWLGNLKYKRALRSAQRVSQEMSRVGFDEFEPFRKPN